MTKNKIKKKTYSERKKDWNEIEKLVLQYQKQFEDNNLSFKELRESQNAAEALLEKFDPLVVKYTIIIKNGQINFNDNETKNFVSAFIDDPNLKAALKRKKQSAIMRKEIYKNFNFIVVTYGSIPGKDIKVDLQMLLLKMAKRYKPMGKSFCGYVATTYKYEVIRHINRYIKNPLNVPYKHVEYLEQGENELDHECEKELEDSFYEDNVGLPDLSWINGTSCSQVFENLKPIERKVLVKYYLEDCGDKIIAKDFGASINAINKIRRNGTEKIAKNLNLDKSDIKRNRKIDKTFNKINKID